MTEYILAIDVGGTNTVFGLVDAQGRILHETSIPTQADQAADNLFKRVAQKLQAKEFKVKDGRLLAVGVGAPNANFYSGKVENPPNLGWGTVNLAAILKKEFGVPAWITNDANASALGELLFGAGKNLKNFIVVTLGTGLGSGVIINGELLYGANGFAGEMGHMCIDFHGRKCACGKRGCLEGYVSATGLVRTVSELMGKRIVDSKLRDVPFREITSELVYGFALEGDPIATEAFEYTAHLLGVSCANVAMLTAPEAFIFCGGLARASDLLFARTKKYMEMHLIENFKNQIQILPSGMDNNPAVLGAAALAWKEINRLKNKD